MITLHSPIEDLQLSTLLKNTLKRHGILLVGDLVVKSTSDIYGLINVGKNSVCEIKTKLNDYNLSMGMDINLFDNDRYTLPYKLQLECKSLISKHTNLKMFMDSKEFYELDRAHKDLLYKQFILMTEYIQVLGQRMELLGVNDFK